jgi:hypothetical protein
MVHNHGNTPVTQVVVRVEILNSQGRILEQSQAPMATGILAPGNSGVFQAELSTFEAPTELTAEVVRFDVTSRIPPPVEVQILSERPDALGGSALFGMLRNPTEKALSVARITLVEADSRGPPVAVSSRTWHPSGLLPGQSLPFLALMTAPSDQGRLQAHVSAAVSSGLEAQRLSLQEAPQLRLDPLGNPLLVGSLHNDAQVPSSVEAFFLVREGEQILTLLHLETPLPIAQGGHWPYALSEFPTWPLNRGDLQTNEALTVQTYFPPRAPLGQRQLVALHARIVGFEDTGSALILRGVVTNRHRAAVYAPTARAAALSLDGHLLTADWHRVSPMLEPGATARFLLLLPLPQGWRSSELELDLQAQALIDPPRGAR